MTCNQLERLLAPVLSSLPCAGSTFHSPISGSMRLLIETTLSELVVLNALELKSVADPTIKL